MTHPKVHFVGTHDEVAHHAAPLTEHLDYQITPAETVVDLAKPGDVAVFYSEHFDRFRDAVVRLKEKHVATLYMIDGILEWRNAWEDALDGVACPFVMRPVLADKVACIGTSQQRVLDSWGNESKTEVVGIPRFDRLPRPPVDQNANDAQQPFRLLIATAKTPAFTPEQAACVEKSLLDLKTWLASNPTIASRPVQVIWRLTADLASKLDVGSQPDDLTGSGLATQLDAADAMIATASTALLEGMLFDVPVALLDYHNTPAYVNTAWSIRSREQISPVLEELAAPPATKLVFQRTQLHDAAYLTSSAAERLAELIRQMQTVAAECLKNQQPLAFPSQMLPPARSADRQAVGYDSAAVFPQADDFRNQDITQLQAQLGHSRREIRQLHERLLVREAELAHAHAIFDKINTHPILGPIVKVGKRLRSMLGKADAPSPPDCPR